MVERERKEERAFVAPMQKEGGRDREGNKGWPGHLHGLCSLGFWPFCECGRALGSIPHSLPFLLLASFSRIFFLGAQKRRGGRDGGMVQEGKRRRGVGASEKNVTLSSVPVPILI